MRHFASRNQCLPHEFISDQQNVLSRLRKVVSGEYRRYANSPDEKILGLVQSRGVDVTFSIAGSREVNPWVLLSTG